MIEVDQRSGVGTAPLVRAEMSKGKIWDVDQLIVRTDMVEKVVMTTKVVSKDSCGVR